MPLFMFVSGFLYILTKKKGTDYWTFILKKFKRLLIPYFSASTIIITIKLLTQGSMTVDNPVTWLSYLKMFYLPEAGYFMWFIWALWWIFVVVELCLSPRSRLILTIFAAVLYFTPIQMPEIFSLNETKRMMIFFMLGTMVLSFKENLQYVYGMNVIFPLIGFVVAEACLFLPQFNVIPYSVKFMCTSVFGIWSILTVSRWLKGFSNSFIACLLSVSACSYIIYLFHTTFEGFFKSICLKIIGTPHSGIAFVAIALLVIIPGVVLPMLLQKWCFAKSKYLKFLFGLK